MERSQNRHRSNATNEATVKVSLVGVMNFD